jgi:hypothetical protein
MPKENIPVIYASIGNREDVNVNPSRAEILMGVFETPIAQTYHSCKNAPGWLSDERDQYINHLEQALLEALSPQFLADRIREVAEDPKTLEGRGPIWVDILKLVADRISPKSM